MAKTKFRKALLGVALCWLATAIFPAMAQTATVAGTTPGQFSVNESGAATYRIPIQVPPGVAGMEPKLELAYNSQGGNGLLGMGWSLAGLSAISRCPRTMAQDGVRGGVNFDMNDRYCLDGQRLILVSGTYGVAGSEYRTELDSFSRIVASGSAGSGVASFIVQTKAGLTTEYGNTADSRIEAQGKATVRVWAVNRISDVKTNFMTFSYAEDNANGDFYPSRIDYAGNTTAGLAPTQSVLFDYQVRTDIAPQYQTGSLIKSTKRMAGIKTWKEGASVKEYRLAYHDQSLLTSRSRISAVTECDSEGRCMASVRGDWQEAIEGFQQATTQGLTQGVSLGDLGTYQPMVADVNGDGKADIVALYAGPLSGGSGLWAFTSLSRGDGTYEPATAQALAQAVGLGTLGTYKPMIADVNGDGRADIVAIYAGPLSGTSGLWVYTALGRGDGTYEPATAQGLAPGVSLGDLGTYQPTVADINGDGKADIVALYAGPLSGGSGLWAFTSLRRENVPDLLTVLTGGAGATTSISYEPLTQVKVYTKDTAPNAAMYPKLNLQYAQYVVSTVAGSNGIGGAITTQYSYGGLKAELGTGRGMLGFRWMKSKNLANNIESYTEFNQHWPFTGSVLKGETRLTGSGNVGVLKRTTNTYAQGTGSTVGTTFVYPSQSIEESWDLDGALYPTITNTYQYSQNPQYGDPTQISVSNSGGAGKTTANEYWTANTGGGNWILGRLKKATVTSVTP